ncbi:MAG TPA: hypothetical protein DCE47_07460 [Planctomycetaceae bacterium]|nr:hypothetical protein [Planctomycetaceae bacterium]
MAAISGDLLVFEMQPEGGCEKTVCQGEWVVCQGGSVGGAVGGMSLGAGGGGVSGAFTVFGSQLGL